MNLVQMNEEILLKFLQEEWRSQVNEPLSEVTLEEYAEYEELLQGLTSPNTEARQQLENDLLYVVCNANVDGFQNGVRAVFRLIGLLHGS